VNPALFGARSFFRAQSSPLDYAARLSYL